jgi:hypothetical protein
MDAPQPGLGAAPFVLNSTTRSHCQALPGDSPGGPVSMPKAKRHRALGRSHPSFRSASRPCQPVSGHAPSGFLNKCVDVTKTLWYTYGAIQKTIVTLRPGARECRRQNGGAGAATGRFEAGESHREHRGHRGPLSLRSPESAATGAREDARPPDPTAVTADQGEMAKGRCGRRKKAEWTCTLRAATAESVGETRMGATVPAALP